MIVGWLIARVEYMKLIYFEIESFQIEFEIESMITSTLGGWPYTGVRTVFDSALQ